MPFASTLTRGSRVPYACLRTVVAIDALKFQRISTQRVHADLSSGKLLFHPAGAGIRRQHTICVMGWPPGFAVVQGTDFVRTWLRTCSMRTRFTYNLTAAPAMTTAGARPVHEPYTVLMPC